MRLFTHDVYLALREVVDLCDRVKNSLNFAWRIFISEKAQLYPLPAQATYLTSTIGFPWFVSILFVRIVLWDESLANASVNEVKQIAKIIEKLFFMMLNEVAVNSTTVETHVLERFTGNRNLNNATAIRNFFNLFRPQQESQMREDFITYLNLSTDYAYINNIATHLSSAKVQYHMPPNKQSYSEMFVKVQDGKYDLVYAMGCYGFSGKSFLIYALLLLTKFQLMPQKWYKAVALDARQANVNLGIKILFYMLQEHAENSQLPTFANYSFNDQDVLNELKTINSPPNYGLQAMRISLEPLRATSFCLPKPLLSITFGDMHANAMKLLVLLSGLGILHWNDALALIYFYERYTFDLEPENKWQLVFQFDELLARIKFTAQDFLIRFIGDALADRGHNDFFILLIFAKLDSVGQNFKIIFSNHDLEAICFFHLVQSQDVNEFIYLMTDVANFSLREAIDLMFTNKTFSAVFVKCDPNFIECCIRPRYEKYQQLMSIYLRHLDLLDYEYVYKKHHLFTHAPTTWDCVEALLQSFNLSRQGSMGALVNNLNMAFKAIVTRPKFVLTLLKSNRELPHRAYGINIKSTNMGLLYNFVWTRELASNRVDSIPFVNVIGHVGETSALVQQKHLKNAIKNKKVINLDSNVGKIDKFFNAVCAHKFYAPLPITGVGDLPYYLL